MTFRWFRFVWHGHGGAMAWLLVGSAITALLHAGFASGFFIRMSLIIDLISKYYKFSCAIELAYGLQYKQLKHSA